MKNNFNNIPYAKWMEQTLKDILPLSIKGVCLQAVTETGEIYTSYHNISMLDKLTISGLIQQDANRDSLIANGFIKRKNSDEDKDENNDLD